MSKKWMQNVSGEGQLSRQLDIPEGKNIPMSLLRKIKNTEVGEKVSNPTKTGKQSITVTNLLKKRAVAAHNMKSS